MDWLNPFGCGSIVVDFKVVARRDKQMAPVMIQEGSAHLIRDQRR